MRRAQLASLAAWTSEGGFLTVLAVYAYEQGGAAAIGLVGVVRLLPAAVGLPFLALLADRLSRRRVLMWTSLIRALAVGCAALAAAVGGPAACVYSAAVVATLAFTAFRPAHAALIPSLCTTPAELANANSTRTLLDGVSALAGPLLAGAILATGDAAWGFAFAAACSAAAAFQMARLRYEAPPLPEREPASVWRDIRAGMQALGADRGARLLVLLGSAQAFVRGGLNVLVVLVAVEMLDLGESAVGLLWAAFGVGALLGASATFRLAGSARLARWFGLGIVVWGVPLVLLAGVSPRPAVALLFAAVGAGNALVDVTVFTLVQRLVPDRVLGRVLGTAEMTWTVSMGLGSVVAPVLVGLLGLEATLVTVGALLPALVLVFWQGLVGIDRRALVQAEEVRLLQGVPMLRPLPVPAIEHLSSVAQRVHLGRGQVVFAEGEPGDRFYVVERGEAEVTQGGRPLRHLVAGDCFGEIALLRPVPRTASVRAVTDLVLRSVDAPSFVAAVTGYSPSTVVVDRLIDERLAEPPELRDTKGV